MLRFFRSSRTIVVVVIFLLGVFTWLHVLLSPEKSFVATPHDGPLFRFIEFFISKTPVLTVWIALLLNLSAAVLLIFVNNRLHLIDKISYLPALCYILLIGGVPMIHQMNPQVIAVLLLITAFKQLISSFKSDRLSYSYFTASFLISTAMFFYRFSFVYMLAVWFSLLFFRPGYWREWVFTILGFALPVFMVSSWYFLVEDNYLFLPDFFREVFSMDRISPGLHISTILFFGLTILVGMIAFRHLVKYVGSRKIIIRNAYYVLICIAVVTIALAILAPDNLPWLWYLMSVPLAFFFSNYLASVRSDRLGTIFLSFLLLGVVVTQIIFLTGNIK